MRPHDAPVSPCRAFQDVTRTVEKRKRVYGLFTLDFYGLSEDPWGLLMRTGSTCQHVKRAEIDRRLAAGDPGNRVARDYGLYPSSLHRHRTKCLQLAASSAIMREVARGTAAT